MRRRRARSNRRLGEFLGLSPTIHSPPIEFRAAEFPGGESEQRLFERARKGSHSERSSDATRHGSGAGPVAASRRGCGTGWTRTPSMRVASLALMPRSCARLPAYPFSQSHASKAMMIGHAGMSERSRPSMWRMVPATPTAN